MSNEVVKPKIERNVDLIEGAAPLRDYRTTKNGEPVFETRNKDEWRDYCIKTKMINVDGSKPCAMCGKVVKYKKMLSHIAPLCKDCKDKKAEIEYADDDEELLIDEPQQQQSKEVSKK